MDAVAQNAVTLGLTKLNALGVPPAAALPTLAAALPSAIPAALPVTLPAALPALPAGLPGVATIPVALPTSLGANIPPPGVVIPPSPMATRLHHKVSYFPGHHVPRLYDNIRNRRTKLISFPI